MEADIFSVIILIRGVYGLEPLVWAVFPKSSISLYTIHFCFWKMQLWSAGYRKQTYKEKCDWMLHVDNCMMYSITSSDTDTVCCKALWMMWYILYLNQDSWAMKNL